MLIKKKDANPLDKKVVDNIRGLGIDMISEAGSGHPNKEVLENLENSKIYRTDQDGSIIFKIKNNKLRIETYSP